MFQHGLDPNARSAGPLSLWEEHLQFTHYVTSRNQETYRRLTVLFLQYGANPQCPALHKLLARNDVLDQNEKQRAVSALQRESKQVEPYSKDGRLNIETSVSASPPYHGYRRWNEDSSVWNPILSGPFRHKEQELLPGQHQSRVPCSCSMGLHVLPDVFPLGKRPFEQFHPHSPVSESQREANPRAGISIVHCSLGHQG